MTVQILLFTLVLVGTSGHDILDTTPPLLSSNCCYNKTVGREEYKQVAGNIQEGFNCTSDCVYEKVSMPGSRFCFANTEKNLPVECNEFDIDFKTIPITYSEREDGSGIMEWVSFDIKLGKLNCTIGAKLGHGTSENVTCALEEGAAISGIKQASKGRKSSKGNGHMAGSENRWIAVHMGRWAIHCPWGVRIWLCVWYPVLNNMIYAEDSFKNISAQSVCKSTCDTSDNCTFWTFSSTDLPDNTEHGDNGRVKRYHNGITECGNRRYTPGNRIHIFNRFGQPDHRQSCGLKNSGDIFTAQTFVQKVFPPTEVGTAWDCQQMCNKVTNPPCKHWTFRIMPSPNYGPCILSNYEPVRKVPIFGNMSELIYPNIVSGSTMNCIYCLTEFEKYSSSNKTY